MRWSQLKGLLEALWDENLDLKMHCTVHRGPDGLAIGRYWIVFKGQTIWEEPRDVASFLKAGRGNSVATEITAVLRQYLDTPKDELLSAAFPGDRWGLTEVLLAADRRIGKRRLVELKSKCASAAALE